MKVILIKDVPNIGKKNEIVEVADGYAKNFLIKNKLGVLPTEKHMAMLNQELQTLEDARQEQLLQDNLIKKEIESKEYYFELKQKDNKSFGVITNKNILDEVNKDKTLITKHMFVDSLKLDVGTHLVKIQISKSVVAEIKINIKAVQL